MKLRILGQSLRPNDMYKAGPIQCLSGRDILVNLTDWGAGLHWQGEKNYSGTRSGLYQQDVPQALMGRNPMGLHGWSVTVQ